MEAKLYSGNSIGAKTTFPKDTEPCISYDGIVEPAGTAPDLKHWQPFITIFNSSLCLGWSDGADRSQKMENIYQTMSGRRAVVFPFKKKPAGPETGDN